MIAKLSRIHPDFKKILEALCGLARRRSVRVYLVGGVVRDLLLNKDVADLDIVVEGDAIALAHEFANTLGKPFRRHHAFGTATVFCDSHKIDFATARKESYAARAVLPRVTRATLREDLFRRDFTVNAMAVSLNRDDYGSLIDYYGGQRDLKKGFVRVLHAGSFLDDPTRIIRAARFACRFGFRIERGTRLSIAVARREKVLSLVHPHRLRDELILMLREPDPWKCLAMVAQLCGASSIAGIDIRRSTAKLMRRVRLTIEVYEKRFPKHRPLEPWVVYLAALLTRPPHSAVEKFLATFDFRKGDRIRVLSAKKYMTRIKLLARPVSPSRLYRFLAPLSFETIAFLYAVTANTRIRAHIIFFLETLAHARLKVRGEDLKVLGIKPHTVYGSLLAELFDATLDKRLVTKDQEIAELRVLARRRGLLTEEKSK